MKIHFQTPSPPPPIPHLLALYVPERLERGWPLLTVESGVNGDSKSTNERGYCLGWLVRWVCRASTRVFVLPLTALVCPVLNIFSSQYTNSILLSPPPSKLGKQLCWVACLLVYVSGLSSKRGNERGQG
jgi:hypothetical protein